VQLRRGDRGQGRRVQQPIGRTHLAHFFLEHRFFELATPLKLLLVDHVLDLETLVGLNLADLDWVLRLEAEAMRALLIAHCKNQVFSNEILVVLFLRLLN
jgi:hypothetical protein